MRLRYAALSDVGRVRRDNQDSGYAGPNLLAVADGVGGSARGDVASSATIEVLRRLDRPPTPEGEDMLGALAGAIHLSHDRIASLVAESPEIEGTSTTVTAVVFDGVRLAVGHVGDSRGYLLRDGTLAQLTTDHTFVQSLIDEGRITEDEARVHPHRNLILRAVDGVHEPEPDVFILDLVPGDRLLLCSDGCSGVLSDADLATLLGDGTPDHAAVSLVTGSLDAGSSDNVTVVVADVVDDDVVDDVETNASAATGPMLVGAAAEAPRRRSSGAGSAAAAPISDTGELEPVPGEQHLDPEEARYAPREPRRFTWARRIALLTVLALLVAVIAFASYQWTQKQYYVASNGTTVAIFRGVDADLPGVRLHRVQEASTLTLAALPEYNARQVEDGISASSLADAHRILAQLRQDACAAVTPTPKPTASAKPTPKPTARAKQTHSPKRRHKASARRPHRATARPTPRPTPRPTASASPSTTPAPGPACSATP